MSMNEQHNADGSLNSGPITIKSGYVYPTVTGITLSNLPPSESVKTDGGGLRDSAGKPRYDLIPPEFMEALAIHYQMGATKYADRNWERGMKWGECFRPLMSHAWKWWRGERYDIDPKMPDYKAPHLIAVAWNAIALYTYEQRNIGTDDRNKQETKSETTK